MSKSSSSTMFLPARRFDKMQNIFDTHAHYCSTAFDEDRLDVLRSLPEKGVINVIECGCSERSCEASLKLSDTFDWVYSACGIHPEDCEAFGDVSTLRSRMMPFWKHEKCVAIGEIGLDYHWEIDKDTQITFFEEHLKVSNELGLPAIIHDREAHGDTLELLHKYKPSGVLHCFSGSAEMAKEIVKLGLYIGFGGAITFKNARKPLETCAAVPLDRILLETDCPYMAPVPFRGQRCDSSMIPMAAEKIAEIHGVTIQEVLDITAQNARNLFKI